MPQRDLGKTGLLTDVPPGPPPVVVPPTPDFQLAARLAQGVHDAAVSRWKLATKVYYAGLLALASGEKTEETLGEDFQNAVGLLRKTPEAIAADLAEARTIVSARRWLTEHDESKVRSQIATEARSIAQFDAQLQNAIAQIRSRAAPHHARLAELQAVERGFTNNAATARSWDHWIAGAFEVSPETLDRARSSP
jgi:hypothetical protein